MSKLYWYRTIVFLCVFCAVQAIDLSAQTFKRLHSFDAIDGANPLPGLIQATDGNFYGTTSLGGDTTCNNGIGCGTVFKITPEGTLTKLHVFELSDGQSPNGLIQLTDGNFYATTTTGGPLGAGTVFQITPTGKLTTLLGFTANDGENPNGLIQATDGNLYGTTVGGGISAPGCLDYEGNHFCGTVFKITPAGLTTLHRFDATDGANPMAGLIQATDGNLYGTTNGGGISASGCFDSENQQTCGSVFKITSAGKLTTLHRFDATDGGNPVAGLIEANDGNLYGTTLSGGTYGSGTVFKITPGGVLTVLHNFGYYAGGAIPNGAFPNGLIQATDGNFYGTTNAGGAYDYGTVFRITPTGKLTTLLSFDATDGANPNGLIQAPDGNFYGTTANGGGSNDGTVFRLSAGLGPFVETQSTSGKVGATVVILGSNLKDVTSVTFNGTSARFKVVSSTEITTTVPSDATTGKVKVKMSSGTLSSNVAFRVTPTISGFSPPSGPVGTSIVISGESFTGATSVTFGGVNARFTVDSYNQITADVPVGAKTGKIGVTTPGGTATSAGTFTVIM